MFYELESGNLINLMWCEDCYQDKHEPTKVIIVRVNGSKVVQEFSSVGDAESAANKIRSRMLSL